MTTVAPEKVCANDFFAGLGSAHFKIPDEHTKIYKDECTLCFNTPFFAGGLYVCMNTYCCFCTDHVREYALKSGHHVFLQIESKKCYADTDGETGEPKDKITKLAIGVDSGFDNRTFTIEDDYNLVMYPDLNRRCNDVDSSNDLYKAGLTVKNAVSAERLEMLQNTNSSWDGEVKQLTKVELVQVENPKQVASSGWVCEAEGCGLTENLWLNLSDGSVLCGRSQYISEAEMSKGNNHMRHFYDATHNMYPLVVKLGTISKDGTADVYSYIEDESVIDPNLEKHLRHFGLDISQLEKTEKSTLEMELDMNEKWEWAKCQEDGAALENIYGPGYTGLINIGSSCYMNSVLQSLLLIPAFGRCFVDNGKKILNRLQPQEIHGDFNAQVVKVFSALMGGKYAVEGSDVNGIKPKQFKRVVAGRHHEFATAKQQDAEEYIRYFLEKVSANTAKEDEDPSMALKFNLEVRFEDISSGGVRYSQREETIFALPALPHLFTPLTGEGNEGRFGVKMSDMIQAVMSADKIDEYTSPVTGENKGATNTLRFKSFPDYLVIQVQRFASSYEAAAKKVDMDVEVDEVIDLSVFRGRGIQEDEHLLPEDLELAPPTLPDYDNNVVSQLEQMGFSRNAAVKAAIEVNPTGGGSEQACEWLMTRLDDPSLNDAPVPIRAAPANTAVAAERPCVQELVNFGFSVHQACFALGKFPDANAAAEWLFEHADEVPPEAAGTASAGTAAAPAARKMTDGSGTYSLVGFISHMGSSPHSGHYVAHLLKDDKWILFNDEKVAISQNPPKQLAYLYLYKRV